MRDRRVRDEGRGVLLVGAEGARYVCAEGHSWMLGIEAILQAGEGAELCPECGGEAVSAELVGVTRRVEQRGVVVDLFREPDA